MKRKVYRKDNITSEDMTILKNKLRPTDKIIL